MSTELIIKKMVMKKLYSYIYHILFLICIFTVLKSSEEQLLLVFKNTPIEKFFSQWETGNNLIYNLSIGYIVSYIFWTINFSIPKFIRDNDYKKKIQTEFIAFKKNIIYILFNAHMYSVLTYPKYEELEDHRTNDELLNRLLDPDYFFKYFTRDHKKDWYAILNGLDEDTNLSDLQIEFRLFERKIETFFNNIGEFNPIAMQYFDEYRDYTYRLEKAGVFFHDPVKYYENILFVILANKDAFNDKVEKSIIENIISSS